MSGAVTPAGAPAGPSKNTLLIVFMTVFLDLVGFGIIIPIQPFYAQMFDATPAVITLLGAIYSLMQFLFAPLWGRLSDRIGRRPVMLVSIAASVVGFTLFGLASSLWMLFLSRGMAGFGNANIGTAQAIIADSTTLENRAKGMGLIGAAFGLGFICGPALGGLFSEFGPTVPAYVAAGLSGINWLLALFLLPETHPVHRHRGTPFEAEARASARPPARARFGISMDAIRRAAKNPDVARILFVYLLFSLSFSLMEQVMGLYVERVWVNPMGGVIATDPLAHMKEAARLTTYVLVAVGITATVVQGVLIGRLARAFGERRLLIAGTIFTAVGLAMVAVAGAIGFFPLMLGVAVVLATGTGLSNPSMSSLLSRAVDPMEQGTLLGLGQSLAAMGRVIGPSVAGLLFQISAPLPFVVGSVLMLGCTVVVVMVRQKPGVSSAPVPLGGH